MTTEKAKKACNNCIHYEICKDSHPIIVCMGGVCGFYKDKSRFVELPCNVGDTVFITEQGEIAEHRVSCIDIGFLGFGITTRCVIECRIDDPCAAAINICRTHYAQREIGKTVFLTREEAEKALKEWKNNE